MVRFITPIYLIHKTKVPDKAGDLIESSTERKVFAAKESIGQNEFYQAQAAGFKPEIKLKIRSAEYRGEGEVRLAKDIYQISRTYDNQGGITEITCSRGVNDAIT